jgi:hypothetical protein
MKQAILGYYIHNKNLNGIIKLFEDAFKANYHLIKGKNKKIIFNHLEHIYRRWYYSPFVDETIASPSNIINTQISNEFKEACVFLPHVTPIFKGAGFLGFNEEYTLFTADNHPAVKDIALLIDNCYPDVEIIDEQNIDKKVIEKLMPEITFKDETYIDFLFSVCMELKLLEELPSINTLRIIPTKKCDEFFSKPPRKQLEEVIEGAVSLAAHRLYDIMPVKENKFNKKFIKNMLTSSVNLEEVIINQFNSLGTDINELLDSDGLIKEPKNEYEASKIAALYLLNMSLDMYITCPFGYYLQLIQPMQINSFAMKEELTDLYKAMNSNMNYEDLIYSTYTDYDLTVLGEELLLKGRKPAVNSNGIKDKNKAYVFKVKHFYNKRSWKMIELSGTQTLNDLHNEIFNFFDLEWGHLYAFFLSNKAWDEDSEYTSDEYEGHGKRASKTKIHSLGLSLKQKFLYLYDFGDEIKFEVELVQVNDLDSNADYPRLIKESKA